MPATLTIRDEGVSGEDVREWVVEDLADRMTVRELIRSRVYQEVQDYNRRRPERYQGLVQPTDAERTLNGVQDARVREIDWKQQYEKACEAFERNGFFILVDDRQVERLEEEVELQPQTRVTFVKLVPLVGG